MGEINSLVKAMVGGRTSSYASFFQENGQFLFVQISVGAPESHPSCWISNQAATHRHAAQYFEAGGPMTLVPLASAHPEPPLPAIDKQQPLLWAREIVGQIRGLRPRSLS